MKAKSHQAKQDRVKPADHLDMTREKLAHAVSASKRILKEAACGRLPGYE